jgi:phage terminase large subunit-like protein
VPLHYRPVYDAAIKNGNLVLTQGNTTDQNYIYDYISKVCTEHEVSMIGYDKYNAAFLVAKLYEDRLPIKEIGQSTVALSPAVKELESLVRNYQIAHDHCPLIGWCFGNVEIYTDPNDNLKLRRSDNASKIDPIVALAMAVECNLQNPLGTTGSLGFMLI